MANQVLSKEELYKKKPEEITMLLYQALERNLLEAKRAIEQRQHSVANEKCQRSIEIVQRLGAGINYEAGIIADQLHVLYEYMVEKIIETNLKKDASLCAEILVIVQRIADSWQQAINSAQSRTVQKRKKVAYEDQTDFACTDDKTVVDLKN